LIDGKTAKNVATEQTRILNTSSLGNRADASVLHYLLVVNNNTMATNSKVGDGHRNGQIKERSQTYNPKTEIWVKRDTNTGRFIDGKADDKPFKGVRKEN
jgi:hypothetical protein